MTLLVRGSGVDLSGTAGDVFTTSGRPLAQAWTPITLTAGGGSGPLSSGIAFPSFDKGFGYLYFESSSGGFGGDACTTYGRLSPQEWGPAALGYTSPHLLDDIDLGASPDGADFLEMSVNLTQSTAPNLSGAPGGSMVNYPAGWPCEISQGSWMDCEDGCCPVEAMMGIARQFWVEIVGGRIVLRRQQSVTGVVVIPNGTSGIGDQQGVLTHLIDSRTGGGHLAGNSTALGGGNQCTITNSVDYSTVYTGQLLITPVNYSR